MSKFGWSYPPGCSGPPDDEPREPDVRVDQVMKILESAYMREQNTGEIALTRIMLDDIEKLITDMSDELERAIDTECPVCLERLFD